MINESNRMNSGFLLFSTDIEMGDENVFNTTGSRLWQRVVLLFQNELKAEYALMRQGRFTVDNIMKYLYGEQISQIPATYYNKDMQRKYLDFGSSYLYALHGSGEKHIKKWIRERLMYVDTLLGYMVSSSDYITLRSNKLGYVYLDIQMYIPMYVTVKWRDEAGGTGIQTKRVAKGETVRFEYNMPTETDQEILVYAGHYIKSLGDLSNLQPSTLLIANANRLTEITCHSPQLINTDLSECKMLQKIDISDCTALGTGIGAQPILNIQNAKYLRYLDTRNTQLTAIYTMQSGSNLEEIYYPKTIQTIDLMNQAYLRVVGIPYEEDENGKPVYCENLADVIINSCKNVEYLCYPYNEGDYVNLKAIKQVQNLTLIDSLDKLNSMEFNGFNKLKTMTLSTMHNIETLRFNDMLKITDVASLESVKVADCPLIDTVSFNISNASYKVELVDGAKIDLGGMQSVKTIESNASIKGLKTLVIPTSTKELKFIPGFGDGVNSIVNVWSATANHTSDGFEGMDLQDISLTFLDMNTLTNVKRAINFHIAPTEQHPNMNTSRTGNYFKPEGSIDLTNYNGDMSYMLKGVDLSLLDITVNKNKSQTSLIGLFEGAEIPLGQEDAVNNILNKFSLSTNWTDMFRSAVMGIKSTDIAIPREDSYREMNLTGLFRESDVDTDITIYDNIRNVTSMFKGCKNLTTYNNNWDKTYNNLVTEDCYAETGGDLELVPVPWGGYGFFDDVTSEIVINVPRDGYEVVLVNRYKVTSFGIVNWGDGTIDNLNDNMYSHVYETAGVYTVKGHFTFGKGYICNTSLNAILIEVKHIASETTDLSQAFKYCSVLQKVNLNGLNPTALSETFSNCSALRHVISDDINTDSLTTMGSMFINCYNLVSIDLSNFNTHNVINMSNLFSGCRILSDIILGDIDTSNAIMMMNMFSGCRSMLELDLSKFNTMSATNMSGMFNECNSLERLNVTSFDTKRVNNMSGMFQGCNSLLELDLSSFDTANVKNFENMFYNCQKLSTINLSNFTTDVATDMSGMFYNCNKLISLDLSKFVTNEVTNMNTMFYGCTKLATLDISNFNTSKVNNIQSMFYECNSLTELNLSGFNTELITNMYGLFYNCNKLTSLDLSRFNTSNVNNMNSMFYECKSLKELNISSFDTANVENMNAMFQGCIALQKLDLSHFNTSKVTSMSYMFHNCNMLSELDVSSFDTQQVTTMHNMFYGCKLLKTLNVSNFVTNNVKSMVNMFNRCESLTKLDLSNFVTSNVTSMGSLFYNCRALSELNISSFNTSKVVDMSYIFNNCTSLRELDLRHFNTDSLTNMNAMFYNCNNLVNLDVSSFNTTGVTTMSNLFYNCTLLTELNLSNFDTSIVTTMSGMFNGCQSLTSLDVNHFVTDNVENMSSMFTGCSCDIVFTNKNTNKVKSLFAMFNIFSGQSIDLSGMTARNSTNNDSFITVAQNLVDLFPPEDICVDIHITADNISAESLMRVINNLAEVAKPQILEIGYNNISKLTDEQLAVAISKNWTVC